MSGEVRPVGDLPWLIVGYGRVGQTLALLAERLDQSVAATWNRTADAAETADVPSPNPRYGALPGALAEFFDEPHLVWLTVVDDAVVSVYRQLADELAEGSIVAHTSGSLASTALDDNPSVSIASLHPLQAIADPRDAIDQLTETTWTVEGDDRAVDFVDALLAPANIEPLRIDPDDKALYHASAVTAANLLVSLFDAAVSMAEAAGIDSSDAHDMLLRLAESNLRNLTNHRPAEALTGPAARGDDATIDEHRKRLAELDDESLLEIYDVLTQRAIDELVE